ncbi:MAG: DUF4157 domain-containing protein, partial [Nitrospiria bacterium]
LQAKTTGGTAPKVPTEIGTGIRSLQGGGRPLSKSERGFFEPRFGQDFSQVRLHNGAQAAALAQSMHARAFTLGHDVVFGAREYTPNSHIGRRLLAHELTHVVQQNGGCVGDQKGRIPFPNIIVQRQEEEPASPEPPLSASVPSPDISVGSVEGEDNSQVNSTLVSSPQLVHDLFTLDPTRFNLFISPVSPVAPVGPLAPINPNASSRFFPNIPSSLQPSAGPTPSVPSELSLFSLGLFHFRLVFEEPALNVSEALRESEQGFSQFVSPPSPGIDTGKLIKGLVTNFLTMTPPGQAILQGVTGALGSGEEAAESTPTVNINLDVLPSPVLQGRPPNIMVNVQGTF